MTRSTPIAFALCLLFVAAGMLPAAEDEKPNIPKTPETCLEYIQARYLKTRRLGVKGIKQLEETQQKAIAPKLVELLDADNWQTVLHAAKSLRAIGETAADQAPGISRRMRTALERRDATRFNLLADTVIVLKGRNPKDFETVVEMMETAGRAGDWEQYDKLSLLIAAEGADAVPTLLDMIRDGDEKLRMQALTALREMGKSASDAKGPLIRIAKGAEPATRRAIQEVLGNIKKDNAMPEVEPIEVRCIEGRSVEIPVAISDADDLAFALKADVKDKPERGTLEQVGPKKLVYTAPPGKTGDVTFTLVATDGRDTTDPITATINVTKDTFPPKIASVAGAGKGKVQVTFDEPVTAASAGDAASYEIGGAKVTSAELGDDGTSAVLEVAGLADGTEYTLEAKGIVDRSEAGNRGTDSADFTFHARQAGLAYALYTVDDQDKLTDREKLTAAKNGTVKTFDIAVADREENYGLLFDGRIKVPADGEYTFTTASDDGSFLWIDGKRLVENGGFHGVEEESGKVTLTAGLHDIRVYFYQGGGGQDLTVSWSGPDIKKQEIPADVLFHVPAADVAD